ncbi:MAG: IS110 family transposase [Planctomycetota bacterium]
MKKLKRRPVRFKGLTVGLDVHLKSTSYSIFDIRGDEVAAGKVESSVEGISELLGKIGRKKAQFVLEASGSSLWVFDLLSDHVGRDQVHMAQPHRIRPIANSLEKNDANDAWWLAYLQFEGRLPEALVPEGELRELRIMTREQRSVTDRRADLVRRFKSHLALQGVKISTNDFHTKAVRRQAAEVAHSIPGARGDALRRLLRRIESLDEEVGYWEAKVTKLCRDQPEVQTMRKEIPGIGPVIAAIVYAELGDPSRYRSAKAFACATGLVPNYRESGGRKMPAKMSRAGSRHARWALTRAIIGCSRCKRGPGVMVTRWVNRRLRHRPKKHVRVAAARKLAEGIWRLFSLGEEFDLAKAFPGGRSA